VAERSRPPGSEAADRLCLPDEDIFSLRIAPAVLPDRGHGNVTRSSPWTDRGASQRKFRTLVNVQTVQTTASQRPRSTSHLSDRYETGHLHPTIWLLSSVLFEDCGGWDGEEHDQ